MEKILTELCHEVNNYFPKDKCYGRYSVVDGLLTNLPSDIQEGQYIRIVGSVFNDGVHKYTSDLKLTDEAEFLGAIWLLAIPQEFQSLAEDVKNWLDKYGNVDSAALSPFNSESFGGYSYSKGGATSSSNGKSSNPNSWQTIYGDRLAKFRRMRGIV